MTIKLNIPSYLQSYTNRVETVEVNAETIGESLGLLIKRYPAIESMLFARPGKLHDYVGIYINGEDAYPDELARSVKDGDEVHIIYVISGG